MGANASDMNNEGVQLFAEENHDPIALKTFGFWLYMLSDALLFSALFAAYEVLQHNYAGGPTIADVSNPFHELAESALIFTSVFAYMQGMRSLADRSMRMTTLWMCVAIFLGAAFIGIEIHDFYDQVARGITPLRSGYLSIYFTLVGTHGLHIFVGLCWMVIMAIQVRTKGYTTAVVYRLLNLKVFWMFQAIVWVCVFIFVYMIGAV